MRFIAHLGGDLQEGKYREFQDWLIANEKEYADSMPEGVKYLGTFFAVYTTDKSGGFVHMFTELDSYGAQDELAALGRSDSTYGRLTNELMAFFDQQSGSWTNALYKQAVDATLYG